MITVDKASHRDLCHLVATWLAAKPRVDLACWELSYGRSIVDTIGVSIKDQKILIAECKRTRADLLAELRTKKFLKYEVRSSHCYLAGTSEALKLGELSREDSINDLTERGLPAWWGVLLINPPKREVVCIRSARRHKSVRATTVANAVRLIGRAHQYRHMYQLGLI